MSLEGPRMMNINIAKTMISKLVKATVAKRLPVPTKSAIIASDTPSAQEVRLELEEMGTKVRPPTYAKYLGFSTSRAPGGAEGLEPRAAGVGINGRCALPCSAKLAKQTSYTTLVSSLKTSTMA